MILVLGLLLWSFAHLFVAVMPAQRQQLSDRLGVVPYRGLFSLVIVGALVLIVMGWKQFPAGQLYIPPAGLRHATMSLMPIALILFVASQFPSDIRRMIRHPQMVAVKTWALAHLLSNGEWRSVVLFGGLMAWAVAETIFINRRDGARVKPEPTGVGRVLITVVVGILLTGVVMYIHPWIAGIPLLPH